MTHWRRPEVLLLIVAILAVAATLARPTLRLTQPTYRYVFVFDITQSMNTEDVTLAGQPVPRLAFAKQLALDALTTLPCGTEAGVALFAGHRAFLLITPIEVCANYREISAVLDNVSGRMSWEMRSEVAKGLFKSIALLAQLPAPTRLVFVSDGHEAPPIDPAVTPQFVGTPGEIAGLVVGVGGDRPAPIPKFNRDGERIGVWTAADLQHPDSALPSHMTQADVATEHLSSLKEPHLRELADTTGLTYLRLTAADELARRLRAPDFGIPRVVDADVRGALGLCALGAFIGSLRAARRPRR